MGLMTRWPQTLPSAEEVGNLIDTQSLTVWDFVWAFIVLLGSFLLARIVRRSLRRVLTRFPDLSSEGALLIARSVGWVIVLVGVVYALIVLNVDIGPALAVIIIIGIVLFFAARGIVENFGSGLVLQGSPMFAVGDQIVTSAGSGVVTEVAGRTVRIETLDGEHIFIPNKVLIDQAITNLTKLGARRSTFEVGVAYGTDVDLAGSVLEEAAAGCATTHPVPAPEALLGTMGDHAIEFQLLFWHDAGILEEQRAIDAVGRAIAKAFAEHGITIAFPQRTLWWGREGEPETPGG
jgi:small conductance mechanosensitive channel